MPRARRYISDRIHKGLEDRRAPPRPRTDCGRNVLNRETGRVETCTNPRFVSGGEKMGCCRDCYDRTRPIGSVTQSYGRIGK
jgi:hypothetical protein